MPTLEAEIGDSLYSMFKGEPGTRKSTQALSYPKPQYWFSWDKKMRALLLPMKQWGINPKDVTYDSYDGWDKAVSKLQGFQTDIQGFKTLVIDSVTSCADGTLRAGKIIKGNTAKKVNQIPVNSIEDYNAEDSALSELLALTKDIHEYHKIHIILIAHVMVIEYRNLTNAETHISRSIVTAGKKISLKIPAYCEEVYHFNIEQGIQVGVGGKYGLLTQHSGDDFARTTLPLPNKIVMGDDPLYDKYVKPAIDKLRNDLKPSAPTAPITTIKPAQELTA